MSAVPETKPYSEHTEKAVLGMMVRHEKLLIEGIIELEEADFHFEENRIVFLTIRELFTSSSIVDEVTIIERLDKMGALKKAGGVTGITDLRGTLSLHGDFVTCVEVLRERRMRRKLSEAARTIHAAARMEEKAVDALAIAEASVFEIGQVKKESTVLALRGAAEAYEDLLSMKGRGDQNAVKTGFGDLDASLKGFNRGDLLVLAARPSVGKSAFAVNIASNVAQRGGAAVIFSLEMTKEALYHRLLVSLSGVPLPLIKSGNASDSDYRRLENAKEQAMKMNLAINDQGDIQPSEMRAHLMSLKAKMGGTVDLVVIDYLQKIYTKNNPYGNRNNEIGKLTSEIKNMAKTLHVPVVLLSQLNRDSEGKNGGKPTMAQLRDSGNIEQDADVVILLDRDKTDPDGDTTAIIAKNRNGVIGDITLRFNGNRMRFESISSFDHIDP